MRRLVFVCWMAMVASAFACGGNSPPPPDLITIRGQVLQGVIPAVGAFVYAVDRTADAGDASSSPLLPILADGSGHFTLFNFGASYDLAISPAGSPQDLTFIRNLAVRDPVIVLPAVPNAPSYSCHIDMLWSSPPPAGAEVAYFLQGPGSSEIELISVAQVDANYADGVVASWRGGISSSANLWTVVFTRDPNTGLPTNWLGAAAGPIGLVDHRDTSFIVSLQTTKISTLSLQMQPADGYSVESADVSLDFGSGTSLHVAHFDAAAVAAGSLTLPVPALPGNRLLVSGVAQNGGATSFAAPAPATATADQVTPVTLDFAAASELLSPDDGATNVDASSTFSWNGNGLNELSFTSTDPAAPTLHVLTTASTLNLDELPMVAAAQFPAGATTTWSSRRWPDIGTTDERESAGFDISIWRSAESVPRTFTFAKP